MKSNLHIKKGDQVVVISGESKGEKGKVISVDRTAQRALVEGINMISKHTKPSAKNPDGGIVKMEAPLHVSKLKLVSAAKEVAKKASTTKAEKAPKVEKAAKAPAKKKVAKKA